MAEEVGDTRAVVPGIAEGNRCCCGEEYRLDENDPSRKKNSSPASCDAACAVDTRASRDNVIVEDLERQEDRDEIVLLDESRSCRCRARHPALREYPQAFRR